MKRIIKKALGICILAGVLCVVLAMTINYHVWSTVKNKVVDPDKIDLDADCILVLGAGVRNGAPSPMLQDRIDCGIGLYKQGVAPKIIMSGDHGRKDYDEVNVMKDCAIESGISSEDVFMDHAGFSTYESMYRAKEIFKVEKMVIVTQKYHLFRALYIADKLGIEAVGVACDIRSYRGAEYREIREVLARTKDFFGCIFKPEPTYLGEAIPITGDGNLTNDKTDL